MKSLNQLRQDLADAKASALALLDAADSEARDLTEAEEAQYSEIEADVQRLQGQIADAERRQERRAAMSGTPALANTVNDPVPGNNGFKDLGEFAHAVRSATTGGGYDKRLMAALPGDTHQGGASSGEGFMVPPAMTDAINEVVVELTDFAALVDEEPTNAREIKSIADESTPWGASGIVASWRSEGTKMDPSKLVTDPRSMPLHELYAFVTATDELLEDAPRMSNRMTRKAGEAIAWKRSDSMFYGTGVGQPLGWMNSGALITVAKESGQAADTIVTENVISMFTRLRTAPGDTAIWIANRDTLPQLMTMTIGDKPIWTAPNGLIDAPGGFLLGQPVMFSEHAKSLGDLGDLQLVSPRGYHAARRTNGPTYAQSMHLYFDYGAQAFRWTFRFGGQPHLSAPVQPAYGGNTTSHFVALAERA